MESESIETDSIEMGAEAATPDPVDPKAARADAYRERFRKAQLVAAQVAKARAAGGQPTDGEAARLVAEFHARGGQVTVCPPGDESKLQDKAGKTG